MKITKEKNFINFEIEENKAYRMNINTGEIIGLRGKVLVAMPKTISKALREAEYGIFALTPLIREAKTYFYGIRDLWKKTIVISFTESDTVSLFVKAYAGNYH